MLHIPYRRDRWVVAALDALLRVTTATGRLLGIDPLGLGRRRFAPPARRILVLRLERIGDLLMSLEAIAWLRRLAPRAEVDLVVGRWNEALARIIPGIDHVRTIDAPWLARDGARTSFVELLRRAAAEWAPREYDVAINLEGDIRSHLLMSRSRAPVRIGFDHAGGRPLLTHPVAFDPTRHTAWNALRLVEAAAPFVADSATAAAVPREPSCRATLAPPVEDVARVEAELRARGLGGRAVIGLHVGGGRAIKQWPPERFGSAVGRLALETGAVVLLTGSAADRPLVELARAALPPAVAVIDLVGHADLVTLAAWLAACRLVVSGDTGPMHLAAAVGTPVVAVFGPSDERRYHPLVTPHRIVARRDDLACAPCNRIRRPPVPCRNVTPACLDGLPAETLYRAARDLWDEVARRPSDESRP